MSDNTSREAVERVKAILEAVGILYRTQMDFVRHDLAALEADKPAPLFEVFNALPALLDAAEERERLAADNAALRECLREIVEHSRNGMTHAEWMEWGRLHGRPNTVALALRAAELCGLDTDAPNHPETPDSSTEVNDV